MVSKYNRVRQGDIYKSGKPVGCVENRVIWTFNLDGASWWRGFQERFVGMVKHYLKKLWVAGNVIYGVGNSFT